MFFWASFWVVDGVCDPGPSLQFVCRFVTKNVEGPEGAWIVEEADNWRKGSSMFFRKPRISRSVLAALLFLLIVGFLWPGDIVIPVEGASSADWNHGTFWHHPWGKSGVHKGIDIFSPESTPVVSATSGLVLYAGYLSRGGNVALVLGPKWRIHYYAHLKKSDAGFGDLLSRGERIGTVGITGNAVGTPPHLHYSIVTLIPYPWRWDGEAQGWKKMFYLNPQDCLIADS